MWEWGSYKMSNISDAQSNKDFNNYRKRFQKRSPDYNNITICPSYRNALLNKSDFTCNFSTNKDSCQFKIDNKNQCSETEFLEYTTVLNLEKLNNDNDINSGNPPMSRDNPGNNCYLWVIRDKDIPSILEDSPEFKSIYGQIPKHSNLTGGKDAYSGGELWKLQNNKYVISGSSGRYQVQTPEELEYIKQAFSSLGYDIDTLGWDYEAPKNGRPKKYDEEGRFQNEQ